MEPNTYKNYTETWRWMTEGEQKKIPSFPFNQLDYKKKRIIFIFIWFTKVLNPFPLPCTSLFLWEGYMPWRFPLENSYLIITLLQIKELVRYTHLTFQV